jgi:dipeptidyl aminopeptidase/acylaminoacyl peptidase
MTNLIVSSWLFGIVLLFAQPTWAADTETIKRPFEVRDAIEMAYFGTTESSQRDHLPDDGLLSPDGRYIVKVTHRGLLPEGVTEGTIWLFETRHVLDFINQGGPSPEPIPLLRMSAAVNGLTGDFFNRENTISELAWANDAKSLTFLGRAGRENRQLFRIAIATRTLTAISPPNIDVPVYAAAGRSLGFLALKGVNEDELWRSAGAGIADIESGVGKPLIAMLYPNFRGNDVGNKLEAQIWYAHEDTAQPVIDTATQRPLSVYSEFNSLVASLSPDGLRFITSAYATSQDSSPSYILIDLSTSREQPLSSVKIAPYRPRRSDLVRAVWSPEGSEVAVTQLDLTAASNTSTPRRCSVGIVSISTGAARCVMTVEGNSAELLREVRWLSDDQIYVTQKTFGKELHRTSTIARINNRWREPQAATRKWVPRIRFIVRESLNERPILVAIDTHTGKQRPIYDPNTQLDAVELGELRVYQWRDHHGRTHRGGLALPPHFRQDRRYPLVVQTHGFNQNEFFRVGFADTANAGRALAAREIIVLQAGESSPTGAESWRDATELGMDVYLAAIDQLAEEGLVDSKRVGISGYSYTGWTTAASIVNAPERFAAAVIANTDPVTFTGYFAGVDSFVSQAYKDVYVGAAPYGEGLKLWSERVPSLASDRIQAAVLFSAADPWHLISFWDLYASMRDQSKPVELQYIRSGQHNISKPLHKLAHQEMIADWFEFWLVGTEQSAPEKADQYRRWRLLKEQRRQKAN